jgi:hypothetical protein
MTTNFFHPSLLLQFLSGIKIPDPQHLRTTKTLFIIYFTIQATVKFSKQSAYCVVIQ